MKIKKITQLVGLSLAISFAIQTSWAQEGEAVHQVQGPGWEGGGASGHHDRGGGIQRGGSGRHGPWFQPAPTAGSTTGGIIVGSPTAGIQTTGSTAPSTSSEGAGGSSTLKFRGATPTFAPPVGTGVSMPTTVTSPTTGATAGTGATMAPAAATPKITPNVPVLTVPVPSFPAK